MTTSPPTPAPLPRDLESDVLVLGGGPAGAWAALAAAESGARVVLADKGFLGTSGATAPSNTGTWCVPPGEDRAEVVDRRWTRTGGLADRTWMRRTVDQSFRGLMRLAEWGYPFPRNPDGSLYVANLRGPDYMRFLRTRVLRAGVTVLDHHPGLELLSDGDAVTGAAGIDRRTGAPWRVRAGGTVLATGGCAFFERTSGAACLTGDGLLMAAEAGASLSGMEFSGHYTLAPFGSSINKGLPFRWASFHREDGTPILDREGRPLVNGIGGGSQGELVRALLAGPVYARLDLAEPALRDWLRQGQPNVMQPHDRRGLDPFTTLFRVELKPEGTVRGTGGLRIATPECGTDIPGLFAAGDAASREDVAGALSGGGAVNSSWAIASGWWAGQGAAAAARRRGGPRRFRAHVAPLGGAGLRPEAPRPLDPREVREAVRAEVAPLSLNWRRHGATLRASLARLDALWDRAREELGAEGPESLRTREAASGLAAARWMLTGALAREESRGMHRRADFPEAAPGPAARVRLSGTDRIAVAVERAEARPEEVAS